MPWRYKTVTTGLRKFGELALLEDDARKATATATKDRCASLMPHDPRPPFDLDCVPRSKALVYRRLQSAKVFSAQTCTPI